MAVWQFDCYIIPKKNVTANACLESDEIFIWGKQTVAIEKIGFLEKQKSWSPKISQYGKSDETCIEFFYENEILIEIYCRLDLRSLSKKILEKILGYAQEIDGMILMQINFVRVTPVFLKKYLRSLISRRFFKYFAKESQGNRFNKYQ